MTDWKDLSGLQIDALREIGNIGAGNAATALAKLIQRKINMSVPRAGIMPFNKIFSLVGGEEEQVACVNFMVEGDAPAQILFVLSPKGAFSLVDMLTGQEVGSTRKLDDLGMSALQEAGNILTSSFVNAFADFTKLKFIPSVPAFAFDMVGAVISSALLEGGYFADDMLVIETQFSDEDILIESHFFLLPKVESLKKILQTLGVSD